MLNYLKFSELNERLIEQYRDSIISGFPEIILNSDIIKSYWHKLENYFPHTQRFIVNSTGHLIGFINAIPLFWDKPFDQLPDDGWDWLVLKGISDYENQRKPNTLGGLQIVVTKENQGKGFSKKLILEGKKIMQEYGYNNFIIPIRPILKKNYPKMSMSEYIHFKMDGKTYDPWIRRHLSSGAKIITVCQNSMNVTGDLPFWEALMNQKIKNSGTYIVDGALNPVLIQVENNHGEYREETFGFTILNL